MDDVIYDREKTMSFVLVSIDDDQSNVKSKDFNARDQQIIPYDACSVLSNIARHYEAVSAAQSNNPIPSTATSYRVSSLLRLI